MGKQFGELVRSFRQNAGKTLQQVADALGVSIVYVSEVERGKRPAFGTDRLAKLGECLGIAPEILIQEAVRDRGFVEVVPSVTGRQLLTLARLARGGATDEQIDEINEILNATDKQRRSRGAVTPNQDEFNYE